MVEYVSECVGCPSHMGCIGSACMYRHVPVLTCDECGCEAEELYEYGVGDGQYCKDCLVELLDIRKVEV